MQTIKIGAFRNIAASVFTRFWGIAKSERSANLFVVPMLSNIEESQTHTEAERFSPQQGMG